MNEPQPSDRLENRLRNRCALIDGLVRTLDAESLRGRPADSGLARFFQAHRECGSHDRRLLGEAVFAWFRWRGALVPHLEPGISGALQALVLDGQWELCADLVAYHLPHLSPDRTPHSTDLAQRLLEFAAWTGRPAITPDALLPDWVPATLRIPGDTSPPDFRKRLLAAFQSRLPTWIRFRPAPPAPALTRFLAACPDAASHPYRPDALRLPSRFNLRARPELERNLIVQDLASQAVAAVCQPQPGEFWWDACSGGGGKSLHLADLMGDSGKILATDIRATALEENRRRAQKAGLRSLRHQIWDGLRDPAPAPFFDGILLDVPCSGMGTWSRNPDARWRLTPDRIAELVEIQARLLEAAAPKVRPGGTLVYATCTLTQAENENQLDRFLASHPHFVPDPMPHPLTGQTCSSGRLWIYPWDGPECNGMFMARLKCGHSRTSIL